MVEDAEFTRARKDLEWAFPRATVPEVSDRKRRDLPIPDSIRRSGSVLPGGIARADCDGREACRPLRGTGLIRGPWPISIQYS